MRGSNKSSIFSFFFTVSELFYIGFSVILLKFVTAYFGNVFVVIINLKKYILILTVLSLLSSCEMPSDLNSSGDKLQGYITHIDTNLIIGNGYYSVSLYSADNTNPFHKVPIRTDSLKLTKRDHLYETTYKMESIPEGNYFVAATWSRYPIIPGEIPIVIGTLGCDTCKTCGNHTLLKYPDLQGIYRNIISWTDTTKRLN